MWLSKSSSALWKMHFIKKIYYLSVVEIIWEILETIRGQEELECLPEECSDITQWKPVLKGDIFFAQFLCYKLVFPAKFPTEICESSFQQMHFDLLSLPDKAVSCDHKKIKQTYYISLALKIRKAISILIENRKRNSFCTHSYLTWRVAEIPRFITALCTLLELLQNALLYYYTRV